MDDDVWRQVDDLYQRLDERLTKMRATAPKFKRKWPELVEKILLVCFHADHMKLMASVCHQDNDEGKRQLREEGPIAQHLCKQFCEALTRIDAVTRSTPAGKLIRFRTEKYHFRAHQIELIISDIIQLLGNSEEGFGVNDGKLAGNDTGEGIESVDDQRGFKKLKTGQKATTTEMREDVCDTLHEAKLRSDIVPPNEIDVTLDDIGALEETKKLIHELVILPITRPELFKGGLLKSCKGILLFGPPGTGKTMLAKAIAKECGANFINVSLASIFCMWIGESEKNVKALFTLAAKVAPTIIFIDEVDSLLGRRTSTEYDTAYRKVKNEFMSLWDGLTTKVGKQILVLGATNRPFDLDEAIIRRFERRIMVNLPCENSRRSILEKLLEKENIESMDFKELAIITEGYTGSDLKNLCTTAAYQPLRELLEQERQLAYIDDKRNTREEPFLRPLNMDDIKQAKKQVAASFSEDGSSMLELKKWNALYGEGGSRMK